jgi:hypothetical protein
VWLGLFILVYWWGSSEPSIIKNSPQQRGPVFTLGGAALAQKIEEAEQELNLLKAEYLRNGESKIVTNPEVFRSLINGLFQAEGHLGVYFQHKESLKLKFMVGVGQNYSKEAVTLLLQLML